MTIRRAAVVSAQASRAGHAGRLLIGAMVAVTPLALAAAEQPAATESTAMINIEEVTVTARRREENQQNVPLAITAVTADDLTRQDLRTVSDLERGVPGLSLCCGRGQATSPFLRGVPGVVGYFAEVPVPLDGGGQLFDVASVQVLKGPQGTLFGLSTNGGAILYEPIAPQDELGGSASIVVGSRDRLTVEGVSNLPLSDSLSLRFSVQSHHAEGYIEDVSTGRDLGEEDWLVGRASMSWRPTDAIENYTVVDYWRSTGRPYSAVVRAVDPNGLFRRIFGAQVADAFLAQQQALGPYKVPGLAASDPERDDRQTKIINRTTLEIAPGLMLKNIVGYVENRSFSYYDRAAIPLPLLTINAPPSETPEPSRQFSEELQLAGDALDGRLTYVLGSFNSWTEQDPFVSYNRTLGALSGTRSDTEARTNALFAEGEYDFSALLPGLTLVGGYRHTWDERSASQDRVDANGVTLSGFSEEAEWNEGSYRLGVRYAMTDRASIYFMNSRGYSSGGFNLTAPESLRVYEPENLDSFELGIKTEWSVGGVEGRTNLATYFGRYRDIQVPVTSRVDTAAGPVVAVVTQNAAEGEIKGVEGEFVIVPFASLELSGNFSWMDAKYTRYRGLDPTGSTELDLSDTAFVYVPEWKFSAAARYTLPMPQHFGTLRFTADYSWQDEAVTGARPEPVPFYYIRPDFETVNASIEWREMFGWQGVEMRVFGTNLTDNSLSNGGFNVYDVLGVWALNSAEPRSYGVRVSYTF